MSIKTLQERLNALGFAAGPEDGICGPQTARAALAALDTLAELVASLPDGSDSETEILVAELSRDEGTVLSAYQDHLGYWTIGTGRLIDKRKGGGITQAEADHLLRNDIAKVRRQLDERLPWWRGLDPVRQRAIQNMAFQLGIAGLLGFDNSLRYMEEGHYNSAASNMHKSLWARQTPARAARVIAMIQTGLAP